ncbi:MAG: hypothetical protein CMC13_12790 [Flavobacteriaceae bacterium]|nr:hypothetical protein [Flavobacteriaceae bacterium]|tara:strand:- start:28167 stop:30788 length:2622 start_codon:yes stop_codon:yes gene_type:complete
MSTKLIEITPQYRSFVDDQVLTSGQLNEFLSYFEDQDRLSRVCLNGVGLVCGFKVETDLESTITISQGCGITTDGDLLKLQLPIDEKEETSIVLENITYTHFKEFDDENAKYPHFKMGQDTLPLWELIPQDLAASDTDAQPLTALTLNNKVVALYLECYPKDADICTTTNCDNQGQPNIQKLRVLLLDAENTYEFVKPQDSIFERQDVLGTISQIKKTAVPRVALTTGIGGNSANYAAMVSAYKEAITQSKQHIQDAFSLFYNVFATGLQLDTAQSGAVLAKLAALDNFGNPNYVQYHYDRVRDLSDTCNEIIGLLHQLKTECCPDISAFPKHLLLGRISNFSEIPELRHEFYPSPSQVLYSALQKKARLLAARASELLNSFTLDVENAIKITPSIGCGLLENKAIPVYYNVGESLLKTWNFNKTQQYKYDENISYHTENLAPEPAIQDPLRFENDCWDFYRIEGMASWDVYEASDEIKELLQTHALDVDVLHFDLQKDTNAFTAFLKKHPSLVHRAGAPKGGTFVIVSEQETVVADFSLAYKIPSKGNQNCCSLMECTYPWISSLKYLNNLSRSLKGTQSRNKPMPQNYILQVIEYKINGESLLDRTVTLRIPLAAIFLRRMHAITEALNTRFDKGVVFDFNESQKRFVITRAKEDTYVIRLRDSTMGNNPIYTYSNSGMFRNNRIFRSDAMRCRDLRSYNPSFYEKLQGDLAPVNKDDDYGSYDEKWAKWTTLRDRLQNHPLYVESNVKRFVTEKAELPQDISGIITSIVRDFQSVDDGVNLHLDGDWVNGTWIDNQMLTHWRRNRKNTHDDVVLFVNLRNSLHNKTGVTKLSIYITGTTYSSDFETFITQYSRDADFYFGAPQGINKLAL